MLLRALALGEGRNAALQQYETFRRALLAELAVEPEDETLALAASIQAGESQSKVLWITRNLPGQYIEGARLSAVGSATWLDQGRPWAILALEDVVYNADVSTYLRQRGQ